MTLIVQNWDTIMTIINALGLLLVAKHKGNK